MQPSKIEEEYEFEDGLVAAPPRCDPVIVDIWSALPLRGAKGGLARQFERSFRQKLSSQSVV